MKLFFALFLLALALAPVQAQKKRTKRAPKARIAQPREPRITEKAFALGAGQYQFLTWYFPKAVRISGRFEVTSGKDIEIFILDADGFTNFQRGNQAPTYYNSGRSAVANFSAALDSGTYYFVVSNRHAAFYNKAVQVKFFDFPE